MANANGIVPDRKGFVAIATNNVNHPTHYNNGGIECIDAMISAYGKEQVAIFCKLNAFKYLFRMDHKGKSSEDIMKANWYINKYNELTNEQ